MSHQLFIAVKLLARTSKQFHRGNREWCFMFVQFSQRHAYSLRELRTDARTNANKMLIETL